MLTKKRWLALILVMALLASAISRMGSTNVAFANSDESYPILAMPVEYVNYTITSINGPLWAKIDGDYPIYVLNESDYAFNGELPMVYPMPPETTSIHVYLGTQELSWTNYTQAYPDALHHTAIGDWWMIYSLVGQVSNFFELKIHYEHPIEVINGSYLFLYNLNIGPYLTPQNSNSTCYYTIRTETNITNLHSYTTGNDPDWNPINHTVTQEGSTTVVSIQEYSDYYKSLPGDMAVTFSATHQIQEFPPWIASASILLVISAAFIYLKTKKSSKPTTLGDESVKTGDVFSNS
jgi:hypothetical protein